MFIIIGILAGFLAGKILRGKGYGLIGNLVIGLIGSYVGEFLFNTLNLNAIGTLGSLLMSTVGAVAFLFIMQLFKR
ncbi:MAG TPA: GlsB/YeaQ/YmgE family stress response membrane protein [Erysipelotrichaceae bacterium]|nr:GlsB/YeaQ/YmgE family stress response membrane protein [Erysipelotrichaceae bacterium]